VVRLLLSRSSVISFVFNPLVARLLLSRSFVFSTFCARKSHWPYAIVHTTDGFGTVVTALDARCKNYLPQIVQVIKVGSITLHVDSVKITCLSNQTLTHTHIHSIFP
jgi:hypothetical protein